MVPCLHDFFTMIDSSKKQQQTEQQHQQEQQQQGFPEIFLAGDFDPLKEKECLEASNQKSLKEVLQLRLQQRRTREQLVEQGIMPPLKSPAAFHEQIKSLERARTENFLKHKIRSRPDRSELVRMHILEETVAEPSLQATQMKLKRARLADDLNEKIAQRPGPMELVEKNILPVDSSVKEAIIVGQVNYPQTLDAYSFDEDSSDALSPEQPASQESQSSAPSPGELKTSDSSPSPTQNTTNQQHQTAPSPVPEFLKPTPDPPVTRSPIANTLSPAKPMPTLVKQSQPKSSSDKHRSKKSKEPKPRVKKLKYHQYIPPDQKCGKDEPEMDSNYARLLQQQQLFLQLQILSQQQQHYNYQTILPAPLKPLNDKPNNNGNTATNTSSNSTSAALGNVNRQNNVPCRKPRPLPSNLDDMKVAELKMELKLRGLPVSGTKTDLIERLKPYQDCHNNSVTTGHATATTTSTVATSGAGELTVAFPIATLNSSVVTSLPGYSMDTSSAGSCSSLASRENSSSPLPMSPAPSEQSSLGTDDTNMTDTFTEILTMMSPSQFMSHSPLRMNVNEDSMSGPNGSLSNVELEAAEKDRKLQEKEKQIEELKRKLEQEQKLVEALKLQLEVEKRVQQQQQTMPSNPGATLDQNQFKANVKDESSRADCSNSPQSIILTSHPLGPPAMSTSGQNHADKQGVVVKQEVPLAKAEEQKVISHFYVSSQRQPQTAMVAQPQALLTTQTAQLLLPVSIQAGNATGSMQLPMAHPPAGIQTQMQISAPTTTNSSSSSSSSSTPGLVQTTASQIQSHPLTQNTFTQHVLSANQQTRKGFPSTTTSSTAFSFQTQPVTAVSQSFVNNVPSKILNSPATQLPTVQNESNHPQKPGSPSQSQQYVRPHAVFNPVTKTKDPPRYEEAIKQARNMQASPPEVSNAHSQQMDDLFDILIKSGEISPLIKEEPSPILKMRPVTASITTMPVNTVVSRPPPQIQVAPPLSLEPTNSLSISLENQLEAFLDGTLSSGGDVPQLTGSSEEQEPFSLIEDLQNNLLNHSSILDHAHSPMETSDLHFTSNSTCLSLDLPDANLDNMEWLDITMPNSTSGLTPLSSTVPSMFSTDFLDSHDLQLHWD
ncbi:myocardin-related transcription factor B isoform X2 [Microcaecilia unicolor]|uniref:Myocardin-related transcription factor B isoform X2 n=1 Tax=Microcaecilia unicolor TaxID=1415580 RepID=A0A6P7YYJ6_9AMPH|nr:myocardin-related transcription factor B isoform X2 [Microcaecilia unicolor]